MYNPEEIEKYAQKIYARYEYFNNYTLETIARRIKSTGQLSAHDQQALKNIADITGDMDAITKKLAEITRQNISDVEKMYTQVVSDGVNEYKPLYDFKGMKFVPFEENEFAQALVENWAKQTSGEMINLSRTKAIGFDKCDIYGNVVGHTPLQGAYEQAISEAVQAVTSGTTDFSTAMSKTVERLGGSGVKVTYGSGVNRSLDAMVRQNLLYGAKQAAQSYDEHIGRELGCDGFEVDAHSGCRPSHEFMQGKMYSYDGKKIIDGITYEDGTDALKALGDYGCLHFKTDVILGVSVPRYSKEELERIHQETTELIEYDGREKTLYQWKQTQRTIERAVRKEETKANMLDAAGMKRKAQESRDRVKIFRDKYDDMCSSVKGLEPKLERMRVHKDISGKTVDISGKSGIIKEGAKKNITIITDKAVESVPKVKISGYSDEQCAFVQQQHKELLRYAKDNNDSKEVAFVFRQGLTDRTEYIGTDDKIDFGTALSGKGDDLFVMHNHPRNSGFSDFDISEFVASDSINSLSIVKNNGNVEVITKSKEYDKKKIIVERERNRKKYIVSGTDDEYRQYINKLLGKLDKKGVIEWIK